jgi:predicted cupin superfamily sugar epimerase
MHELIKQLELTHLDHESGLFVVENISNIEIEATDGRSPISSCIYYALTKEQPQNHLHWLMPDDHHILIAGGPADYHLFHSDGKIERHTLGLDISNAQRPIVVSPGGCQKAVRLQTDSEFMLVGSVVTPAWNPDRVRFGGGQAFIDKFAGKADWATPEFLKGLIGPNWRSE